MSAPIRSRSAIETQRDRRGDASIRRSQEEPTTTLEATLDRSDELLEPDEQHVLRTLGVFIDGFDLDGVAA